MIALSPSTRDRLLAVFEAADADAAIDLLQRDCADNVHWPTPTPVGLERLRFAAIRYSGGTLLGLGEAVALARTDWRDLLVAAGFADHVGAHMEWRPTRFDKAAIERWLKGDLPGRAQFQLGQAVLTAFGPHQGRTGTIISLVGLEPEPKYSVEWETGKHTTTWQHLIAKAE